MESKVFERGSQEWLEFRKDFVTATEISILLGMNKYTSPSKLLKEKLNPTFTANVYTRMGKILEPAVANLAEDILGIKIQSNEKDGQDVVYFHEFLKLSATPDGTAQIAEGSYAVELKTTSRKNLETWSKSVPVHYAVQLIQQMILTKADGGFLVIMTPEYPQLPAVIYRIDGRVPARIIDQLSNVARRFMAALYVEERVFRRDKCAEEEVNAFISDKFECIHSDVNGAVETEEKERPWWETD